MENEKNMREQSKNNEGKTGIQYQQQTMKREFSISIITIFLLLIATTSPSCLNPTQPDGLCSSCSASQNLLSGYCVTPLPGCITQISPSVCTLCNASYTLTNNICLSLQTATAAPPSNNPQQQLHIYTDNAPNFRYQLLDFYFKGKYLQQLNDKISNITLLYQLQTSYGIIFSLTYMNPYSNAATIYRAEALVDYFNNITEMMFTTIDTNTLNNYASSLWFIDRKILVENLQILSSSFVLNKVQQQSSNDYRLFYINFDGSIFVIDAQRTTNPSSPNLSFLTLTQIYYQINQDTVLNYVFSLFPNLQLHNNYTVNFYSTINPLGNSSDFYKFVFDSKVIVIISVKGLTLALNTYQEPDNVYNLLSTNINTSTTTQTILGGYLAFVNLQDATYLACYQQLLTQYPFLSTKTVQEVRYQMVAGTNFMIEMNNQPFSNDNYVAIVFKPLSSTPPTVTQIYKNGVNITSTILTNTLALPGVFNYEADSNFKNLYTYFRQAVINDIKNILPISSVQSVANPNKTVDYLVIYTPAEYAFLRYSPTLPTPYQIISYTVFGILIPISNVTFLSSPQPVARNALLAFLTTMKPSLFTQSILISYKKQESTSKTTKTYEMDLLTQYGTYYTRVNQNGLLYLSDIIQNSFNTCSDLDKTEYYKNPTIASLNSFILQNYAQVATSSLTLVQGYVSNTDASIRYRMLYALNNVRQEVQVILSLGKYMINKITAYDGTGCDQDAVLQNGTCNRNCQSFSF